MTESELLRANELKQQIDVLWRKYNALEEMQKLCREDADIAKKVLYNYSIKASALDGMGKTEINISAIGVFLAVDKDMDDLKKKIDELSKEFSDL